MKNASSQVGGRLFLSLSRFGIAAIIVRYAGADRFGEYALILSQLFIAEWVADFGLTDIAVRDICQSPGRRRTVLDSLAAAKLLQGVAAFVFLVLFLLVIQYPARIVRVGALGGVSVLFYAAVLVYRSVFRSRMTMERDVLAEVAGVLVMAPLVWYACKAGATLDVLVGCYVVSRVVFLGAAMYMGRGEYRANPFGADMKEVRRLFREAAPLGVAGLLVCFYGSIDPIMLSKLADFRSVAYFSSSMNFVFPAIIVVQALGSTVFPLLSTYWKTDMERFTRVQQGTLDMSFFVGAGMFCIINSSADFLMGLLGPDMLPAAYLLRYMSWIMLARTVTTIMAPLIIVSGGQKGMLWLTAVVIAVKTGLLYVLIPRYGMDGVVVAYLISEVFVGMAPTVLLSQYVSGARVRWGVVGRASLAAGGCVGLVTLAGISGTLAGGAASAALYLITCFGLGVVSAEKLRPYMDKARARMDAARARA